MTLASSHSRSIVTKRHLPIFQFVALLILFVIGCSDAIESEVVLHSTVDQEVAAPLLAAFYRAQENAVKPRAVLDTKRVSRSEKVELILAATRERAADVLFTNDVMLAIELQKHGILAPHAWRDEPSSPRDMRSSSGHWYGMACIARVLIVNTDLVSDPKKYPQSVEELADERWAKRCAMARPLSENSAIHAAVLVQKMGEAEAMDWFAAVAENCVVLPNNQAVASAVALGKVDWGLTDSSDAVIEQDDSSPIDIVFPDQLANQAGTLRVPHAVAVFTSSPHPIAAGRLADYLTLPTTEDRLAMADTAQLPISRLATFKPRVLPDSPVRWMQVDFAAAYEAWASVSTKLELMFPESLSDPN